MQRLSFWFATSVRLVKIVPEVALISGQVIAKVNSVHKTFIFLWILAVQSKSNSHVSAILIRLKKVLFKDDLLRKCAWTWLSTQNYLFCYCWWQPGWEIKFENETFSHIYIQRRTDKAKIMRRIVDREMDPRYGKRLRGETRVDNMKKHMRENVLWWTLFQDQPHKFSLLALNLFSHPFLKSKFPKKKKFFLTPK